MKYGLARVTALGLVFAAELLGQTHPSFSGTWFLDPALSVGLRDEERKGMTLVVRQTDREIVFERTVVGGQTRVIRYALDGSESTSRAGSVEIKARSRWEGEKLITEGTQSASVLFIRIKAKFIETRSVSNDGQVMTAHSTFWRGDEQTDRKLVFKRGKGAQ